MKAHVGEDTAAVDRDAALVLEEPDTLLQEAATGEDQHLAARHDDPAGRRIDHVGSRLIDGARGGSRSTAHRERREDVARRLVVVGRTVQDRGCADCALATNRGNFHHAPILEDGQHRTEPCTGKVHVPDRFPGFVENLLEPRRYGFERLMNACVIIDWKSREQAVWVPFGRWGSWTASAFDHHQASFRHPGG